MLSHFGSSAFTQRTEIEYLFFFEEKVGVFF